MRTAEVVRRGHIYGIPERTIYRHLRTAERQGLVESRRAKGQVTWALSDEWRAPASMALAASELLGFAPTLQEAAIGDAASKPFSGPGREADLETFFRSHARL